MRSRTKSAKVKKGEGRAQKHNAWRIASPLQPTPKKNSTTGPRFPSNMMRAAALVLLSASAATGQVATGACAHDSNGDGIVGVDGEYSIQPSKEQVEFANDH